MTKDERMLGEDLVPRRATMARMGLALGCVLAVAVGACGSSGTSAAGLPSSVGPDAGVGSASGSGAGKGSTGRAHGGASGASDDTFGNGNSTDADAGVAGPIEAQTGGSVGESTGAAPTSDVDGGEAEDGGKVSGTPACLSLDSPCTDTGPECCSPVVCKHGVCGMCIQEGAPCAYDGGNPEGAACCGGLACNHGYCGSGLCSPDSAACGAADQAACCNDDCNNGTCGG